MRTLLLALAGLVLARPAAAHHPLDGAMPTTAWQGLLSGFGHPVIGPDHLLFLLAAATAAALAHLPLRRTLMAIAAFVVAGGAGSLLRVSGGEWAAAELAVALSLVAAGAALAMRRMPAPAVLALLALAAGGAHGFAFGEAVVGAEPTPVTAYLAGLAVMQSFLLLMTYLAAMRWLTTLPAAALQRLALVVGVLAGASGLWFASAGIP